MVKDYAVTVTVRNGPMLAAMRGAGCATAAELSRATGVTQSVIGGLLSLKQVPVDGHGDWRKPVLAIAEYLRCLPEDLFPVQHVHEALRANKIEIAADMEDLAGLHFALDVADSSSRQPDNLLIREEALGSVRAALRELPPRVESVLRARMGFDDEPKTLEEIARDMGVNRERVRQIEAKGLRLLKEGSRVKTLRSAAVDLGRLPPETGTGRDG